MGWNILILPSLRHGTDAVGITVRLLQHIYGTEVSKGGAGEWNARACVEGSYSRGEREADDDLGKVRKLGINAIHIPYKVHCLL